MSFNGFQDIKSFPKVPPTAPSVTPSVKVERNVLSGITKWAPIILAGAAVGMSVVAIKEIKNVRKELNVLKKADNNTELIQKMERMDQQLIKISEFLANQTQPQSPYVPKTKKANNVPKKPVKNEYPVDVNIINEEPKVTKQKPVNDVVYEYVEVTDSEDSESEN